MSDTHSPSFWETKYDELCEEVALMDDHIAGLMDDKLTAQGERDAALAKAQQSDAALQAMAGEVERLRGLLRYAARHIPSASGARMYVFARIDGDPAVAPALTETTAAKNGDHE